MSVFARVDRAVRRTPPALVLVVCAVLLASLAMVDLAVGPRIRLYLLYWLPIAVASWCCGRRAGIIAAVVGSGSWLGVNFAEYAHPEDSTLVAWNGLVTTVSLLLIAVLTVALRRQLDAVEALADRDSLTGLTTARLFEERLAAELRRSARTSLPLTVAYLDLDDFKAVNDRLGHAAGDEVLRTISQEIAGSVREVDTVARLGGDELAILAPECPSAAGQQMVDRIRTRVAELAARRGWPVGLSAGLVTCARKGCTPNELVQAADALMYEVKRTGKGASRAAVLT